MLWPQGCGGMLWPQSRCSTQAVLDEAVLDEVLDEAVLDEAEACRCRHHALQKSPSASRCCTWFGFGLIQTILIAFWRRSTSSSSSSLLQLLTMRSAISSLVQGARGPQLHPPPRGRSHRPREAIWRCCGP